MNLTSPSSLPTKQPTIILKLGGAAITNKKGLESLKADILHTTVQHIAHTSTSLQGTSKLVTIHGAGSFGHRPARDHNVQGGWFSSNTDINKSLDLDVLHGFEETRFSVRKLNHQVVGALQKQGVPAVGLSALQWWTYLPTQQQDELDKKSSTPPPPNSNNNKQNYDKIKYPIDVDLSNLVRMMYNDNVMPVLHGDSVYNKHQGCSVLSGDRIITELCFRLPREHGVDVRRVVFLTDVPGVFTRFPFEEEGGEAHPDARLVRKVMVEGGRNGNGGREVEMYDEEGNVVVDLGFDDDGSGNSEGGEEGISGDVAVDVTGGIKAKLEEAISCAVSGVESVRICEVGTRHALDALMMDALPERWRGTEVAFNNE